MNPNHKWYKVAKAWLEGAEIECRCRTGGDWYVNKSPSWAEDWEYRVKPEPQWYDDIPKHGMLCWVSDTIVSPSSDYALRIISRRENNFFADKDFVEWKFATPLTEAEIRQFLPANDLQSKLAMLEAFKQEYCPEFNPDWNDLTQEKWFVYWSYYLKTWVTGSTTNAEFITIYLNKPTAELLAAKLNSGEVKL